MVTFLLWMPQIFQFYFSSCISLYSKRSFVSTYFVNLICDNGHADCRLFKKHVVSTLSLELNMEHRLVRPNRQVLNVCWPNRMVWDDTIEDIIKITKHKIAKKKKKKAFLSMDYKVWNSAFLYYFRRPIPSGGLSLPVQRKCEGFDVAVFSQMWAGGSVQCRVLKQTSS